MSSLAVPFDLASERAVLGAVLRDPAAVAQLDGELDPDAFYLPRHGLIYAAMRACYARRVPPDLVTVAATLRASEQFDAAGGASYLADVQGSVPHAGRIGHYAASVAAAATRRRMIEAGGLVSAAGYDEDMPLDAAMERAEQALYAATRGNSAASGPGFTPLADAVRDRATQYGAVLSGETEAPGVRTGLHALDALTGGLKPGQLVLIAARPSVGKSALMQSMARHIAGVDGAAVGIISLEMSQGEIVDRFVAQETGLPLDMITNYRVRGPQGEAQLYDGFGRVSQWPIFIDDAEPLTISAIRARVRRLHRRTPLACLFVDYLQRVAWAPREYGENEALTTISKGLKSLARELAIPVVALAQLNREVEKRANPIPLLADLRGSGSLEQDADLAIFPVRPSKHDANADPRLVELHLLKQRNGPLGVAPCHFDAARTLHTDVPSRYATPEGY